MQINFHITIGQYLQPSNRQLKVERYVTSEEFQAFKFEAYKLGFRQFESGPLVRFLSRVESC